MNKLEELLSKCKCGIFLSINEHRDYYMSVDERLKELSDFEDSLPEIDVEVRQKMIDVDTIIEIHFYPDTPINFYRIFHWDLEKALDQALKCISGE